MIERLRGRFALLVPLLAAVVLLGAACDLMGDDEDEDLPPLGTPAPTTPTPVPNDVPEPDDADRDLEDDDAADDDIDGDPAPATGPDPLNGLLDAETVEVTMQEFEFDPNEITIEVGELYEIVATNAGAETHTFTIDEIPADHEVTNGLLSAIADDADVSLELGADMSGAIRIRALEAGEYQFYCAVPGHADEGMEGTLIVEEPEE